MSADEEPEFDLVMPFVTVTSVGGPHDDESYVAGFRMGQLDMTLSALAHAGGPAGVVTQIVEMADNARQVDLIAMRHGFTSVVVEAPAEDLDIEGWKWIEIRRQS